MSAHRRGVNCIWPSSCNSSNSMQRSGAEHVSVLKRSLWGGEGSVLWLLLLSCRMCPVPLSARMCENRRDEEGSGRINLICRWNAHSSSVRPSCTHILLQKNITLSRLPSCLIMEYRVEFLNLFHFDLSPSSLSAHLLDYSAQLWR